MQFQHPSLHLGASAINGQGLFSTTEIRAGEIVAIWDGFIATVAEVDLNWSEARYRNCSQVGDDQFLVPYTAGAADHVNHSCYPNCGIRGTNTLLAMRDIPAAEEITYDYAMTDGCNTMSSIADASRRTVAGELPAPIGRIRPYRPLTTDGFPITSRI